MKYARKRLGLPVLPAIMIASGATTANALELGTIDVQSTLGQPLRASIAYALAPNEAINEYCVSLVPAGQQNGLPQVSKADISVANGIITISGKAAIADPLLTARLQVKCPYTPTITREFMVFVDPAGLPGESRQTAATALPEPRRERRPVRTAHAAIAVGSASRVQPGDSLSKIARRLNGGNAGMWEAVDAIFDANPNAFIDADPNKLKAGAVLHIPGNLTAAENTSRTGRSDESLVASAAALERSISATAGTGSDQISPLAPVAIEDVEVSSAPLQPADGLTVSDSTGAGTLLLDSDGFTTADAMVAPLGVAATTAESTEAPIEERTVVSKQSSVTNSATGSNPVWWILGGALAVIGGLMFKRRRRDIEPDDTIANAAARTPRPPRHLDEPSIEVEIIDMPGASASIDYELSDTSPTEENLALDANLFDGQGLGSSTSIQESSIGTAEALDMDFGAVEVEFREPEERSTDVNPAPECSAGSILESEVLTEEDDYELSVVMDVTKTPIPEDATERDLKAVVVDESENSTDADSTGGYTLSKEVDYQILEQDYEDELTATQALNMEIERAARELMAESGSAQTSDAEALPREETMALPVVTIAQFGPASARGADNDDLSAADNVDLADEFTIKVDVAGA